MVESCCGLLCSQCSWKASTGCGGCISGGDPFWGVCPVKSCCGERRHAHCGQCGEIPCELLTRYTEDPEHGDGGQRVRQCLIWKREGTL